MYCHHFASTVQIQSQPAATLDSMLHSVV
ncbi:hypothetical protein M3J09_007682 [Ascochyta lentis]